METAENYVDACFRLNQTLFMHGCARKQQAIMSSGKRDVEDYSRSMETPLWMRSVSIQALKSKYSCRQYGQVEHWANDPTCPKGSRKGKGKSSTALTTQYASTKGHKSNKRNPNSVQFTSPSMIGGEAHCRSSGDMAGRTTYEILHAMIAQAQAQQDQCAPHGPRTQWQSMANQ